MRCSARFFALPRSRASTLVPFIGFVRMRVPSISMKSSGEREAYARVQ